jgi:hypothetical protein
MSRAFVVSGDNVAGLDGVAGAGGALTWSHWRATVRVAGGGIVFTFQCGSTPVGLEYTVNSDEVILFYPMNNSRHAYHFKRM